MTRGKFIALILSALVAVASAQMTFKPPEKGLVPDAATAEKIAEAVLFPLYGEEMIKSEKPYEVRLEKDRWIVGGTLPNPKGEPIVGGTFYIIISRQDARIIDFGHFE